MTEQDDQTIQNPNRLVPIKPGTEDKHRLARQALLGMEMSAEHFYGDSARHKDRPIINGATEATIEDGMIRSDEEVLKDTLERMRSLETIRTRSLIDMKMSDSESVSFTAFEHYTPKVAPTSEVATIPTYLSEIMDDSQGGFDTYEKTIEQEGWQAELFGILEDYLNHDPSGKKLIEDLGVRSLKHLTPEQAVKLSAAFVQGVSKYSTDDMGKRADQSTTMELLREGIAKCHDPEWAGNGVCRNVASNVKAVFEAIKSMQAELSMLGNTYCVYCTGKDGEGYADSRPNPHEYHESRSGHAWDTFVTVNPEGSSVMTIIDTTWAIEGGKESAIDSLDRTEVRAVAQVIELFKKSESKADAFVDLTRYIDKLVHHSHLVNKANYPKGREAIREYATFEYLKVVSQMPEIPDSLSGIGSIMGCAYQMKGRLEPVEIIALFKLDKARDSIDQERLKSIIVGYDGKREVPLPAWKTAENLTFGDDELQELAYEAVGQERVLSHAENSGEFRARLRDLRPEDLPVFDAESRPADAAELGYFAEINYIQEKSPKRIMKIFHDRLKKLAGDPAIYEAIVHGRDDYDIARSFKDIAHLLKTAKQSTEETI